MKWNKENKERLWRLLWEAFAERDGIKGKADRFKSFKETFGIEIVFRGSQIYSPSMMWLQKANYGVYVDPWGQWYKPAASKNHVIVNDIFHDNPGWGFKIPKDVAEKFLVLGVP